MRYLVLALTFVLLTVPALAAPVMPGLVDSASPILVYTGSWTTEDVPYAVGGSARSTASGTVTFDLYATGFTVFFLYSAGGGEMDVCVDADCVTVATDGAAASGRVDMTGLAAGAKSVSISPASATPIYFDALYVYPDPPAPVDTATRGISSEFTILEETYTGTYELTFTAGDITLVVLMAALITVQIGNLVLWIWYRV